MSSHSRLRHISNHNWNTLRTSPWSEVSGALGDLGTLLPLLIALTLQGSISFSSTLVFSGLANILTGLYYGIPLPVQPMKAIASIAISSSFSKTETASAGFFVAACVLLLSITGLLHYFTRIVPLPVIRGIQIAAGLSLIISAGSSLLQPLHWITPALNNHLLTLLAFLLLLLSAIRPLPSALLITSIALLLSLVSLLLSPSPTSAPYIWHPHLLLPTPPTFLHASLKAGLPQLPLTTLNSILAVSSLASSLSPPLPAAPTPTSLGLSVGLINLVAPWFAAMPVCHGSGGLAGQYRFGARSGASVVLLGLVKLLLGLFVGETALPLLQRFPRGMLGVMVLAAGVELARVGREGMERDEDWAAALVTVAGCLAFRNDGVGFAVGMVWVWGMRAGRRWKGRGSGEEEPLLGAA
ncbi:hypothetical protein CAC42_1817 [Sphaceloma murrayae]|uniref:Molybdate transporter 1 n=1 Tax=Sphaceloma murrayae TaxID=2082308 RepID=A0A2K1QVJ5_9PEZI|nr:hypothetical protein CAC42_1817 [Sphaceloma murrayae]